MHQYVALQIFNYLPCNYIRAYEAHVVRGAVALLALLTLDQAVQVQPLSGDIVFCSWTRLFTLKVPLSTQVYKLVPTNLMLGVTL